MSQLLHTDESPIILVGFKQGKKCVSHHWGILKNKFYLYPYFGSTADHLFLHPHWYIQEVVFLQKFRTNKHSCKWNLTTFLLATKDNQRITLNNKYENYVTLL